MRRSQAGLELSCSVLLLWQEGCHDGAAGKFAAIHGGAGGEGAIHVGVLDDDLAQARRRRLAVRWRPRDDQVCQLQRQNN